MNRGVDFFYYTQQLPPKSIAIAQISTQPATPAQLTDINNSVYESGVLTATMHDAPFTVFTAFALEQSIAIGGDIIYQIANQFFELTDQTDSNGNPLYYQHPLPSGVTTVTVLDLEGNTIPSGYVVRTLTRGSAVNTYILHSFADVNNQSVDFVPYQVRYIDAVGNLNLEVLQFQNVIAYNPFQANPGFYTTTPLTITVNNTGTFYIRWYSQNGYQLLLPYGTTPNDPWFLRVRYNLVPTPPEYATQVWNPQMPYILATWVPGTVLSSSLIQFERSSIYFNNNIYPDVLVYDKNYVLKYALAGKTGNGFLFPWKLNQFSDIDPNTGVVEVAVTLDPTDIVFGFYSYQEPDVIFSALDINPYTNPTIRNTVIQFYQKSNGEDPLHYIYYNITNGQYPTQNLLASPNNPTLAPWFLGATPASTITLGQSDPAGGTKAFELTAAYVGSEFGLIGQTVTPQPISSQTFVWSVWMKTTGTPVSVYLLLEDQGVDGHVIINGVQQFILTNTWQLYQITSTTYPTSTLISAYIYNFSVATSILVYNPNLSFYQPLSITNDPEPLLGDNNLFGTAIVGQATSIGDFTFTDVRQRGGGLAPQYQNIPQAVNFWDLGYWDGEPFPSGGSMIVYLPVTLQSTFSTDQISQIVNATVPMGTIPVIRYYDSLGNETVA